MWFQFLNTNKYLHRYILCINIIIWEPTHKCIFECFHWNPRIYFCHIGNRLLGQTSSVITVPDNWRSRLPLRWFTGWSELRRKYRTCWVASYVFVDWKIWCISCVCNRLSLHSRTVPDYNQVKIKIYIFVLIFSC